MLLETFTRVALAADPPVNPIPIEPRGGEFSILLRLSFRAGLSRIHMSLPLMCFIFPPIAGVIVRQFDSEELQDE